MGAQWGAERGQLHAQVKELSERVLMNDLILQNREENVLATDEVHDVTHTVTHPAPPSKSTNHAGEVPSANVKSPDEGDVQWWAPGSHSGTNFRGFSTDQLEQLLRTIAIKAGGDASQALE